MRSAGSRGAARRGRARSEDGSALVLTWVALVVAGVAVVVLVDLFAYLAAAGRARSAADGAALAAAAVAHPRGGVPGSPVEAASRVAEEQGATLVRCACRRGARDVAVEVSVAVEALVVTRFTGRSIHAEAEATLVPARSGP